MATRTVKTGDDVDAALGFLGKKMVPQITADEYFDLKMQEVVNNALTEADEKRFNLVKELMNDENKGDSISKLRELLGV